MDFVFPITDTCLRDVRFPYMEPRVINVSRPLSEINDYVDSVVFNNTSMGEWDRKQYKDWIEALRLQKPDVEICIHRYLYSIVNQEIYVSYTVDIYDQQNS